MLAVLIFLLLTPTEPVGMVLQVGGTVEVTRSGQTKQLQMADLLYVGDQIKVGDKTAVVVFCPSSEKISLKPESRVTLTASAIEAAGSRREKVSRCSLPRVALGEASMERIGGLRARGHPPVLLFAGGRMSTRRPELRWAAVPEAETYVVSLKDDDGKLVWEKRTAECELTPDEPLEDGKSYRWEVRAEMGRRILAQQSARLEIQVIAGLSSLQPDDLSDAILLATELQNAGYYSEAASYFRQLQMETEDERLTRHLAWLYWNAGLLAAANAEREKLP